MNNETAKKLLTRAYALQALLMIRKENEVTQMDLIYGLRANQETISKLLAELEQFGFVSRKKSDDVREKGIFILSKKGEKALDLTLKYIAEVEALLPSSK